MAFSYTSETAITNLELVKPCKVDTNKWLVCDYASNTATFHLMEYAGGSITKTDLTGTLTAYDGGSAAHGVTGMIALDPSTFVFLYYATNLSTNLRAICATLSGTTLTYGDPVSIGSSLSRACSICALSSTKFVVGACSQYSVNLACGTVSTRTITLGTVDTSTNSNGYSCSVFKLGTDKFGYIFQTTDSYLHARAGTVSTVTITLGTEMAIRDSSIGTTYYQCTGCAIDTDKFLSIDGQYAKANLCTVSGTDITVGGDVSIATVSPDYRTDCDILSATEPLYIGRANISGYKLGLAKGVVSGTTLTAGTWENAGTYYDSAMVAISSSTIAFVRAGYTKVAYIPSATGGMTLNKGWW